MHEMSICESILGLLQEQAQAQNFSRVDRICLEIGPLSGVEVEALKFGFDVVMRGTLAEGARLDIIEPEGKAWCMPCGQTVTIEQRFDACPECGSHQLQVTGGDELRVKELEVN
ncbi:hydrogenase maturation nickel metallochaperone HypA [Roseibium aggregatum]|jgi:hydrogenase nickel incorporation protein HypA/HybF|uniref:Hydrogenase maturation factor HypA n=1 Tax=Roseibium aggregatum (strain ATCC 25650 / DSM 13394 / JCM 20685 / NBRC 16684 / NCIMB 2208 / IAM 12614 / B1) TaxID=384765 RepID=A0P1N0_ROSAI|nr:hydrogenase maturation nickel metallochaperone HypA [Roseibium aggregatum]EAV40956.1 HypA protein [Stappia aggregata IAM 12614] [Roseibium aggregatum IAM 12614]